MWQELVKRGEIYLGTLRRLVLGARRGVLRGGRADAVEAASAPTGAEVEWVEEENYFFRLSAWQDRLLALLRRQSRFHRAARAAATRSSASSNRACSDLSVSRTSFSWGIPVPGDPKHVMYVWLDALTNYITALGYPDVESAEFRRFWPADLHMVGKDILRFHAVYWPAFLMAAGLAPPKRVFAHGWWTVEGEKMSKSLGNVIDPPAAGRELRRSTRCAISCCARCRSAATAISRARAMVSRINSDLANDLGNLAQRVLSMIDKKCGGARARARAAHAPPTRRCSAPRAACLARCAPISPSRRSIARWSAIWQVVGDGEPLCRRAGALDTCARPIRRAWRRCSTCWPRRSAISPSWCSRSCRGGGGCSTSSPCRQERAISPRWPRSRSRPGRRCRSREGIFPAHLVEGAAAKGARGKSLMLVDSHCHLDFPDFGEERREVLARARRAGIA